MNDPVGKREADIVAAAGDVADTGKALAAELRRLKLYGIVNRGLAVLSLALVIAVIVLGYFVSRNTATVAAVHQSNLAGCRYNNTRLANQAKALNKILAAAQAPPGASAQQRAASDAFEAKAHAAVLIGWAPRNCTQAYKLP